MEPSGNHRVRGRHHLMANVCVLRVETSSDYSGECQRFSKGVLDLHAHAPAFDVDAQSKYGRHQPGHSTPPRLVRSNSDATAEPLVGPITTASPPVARAVSMQYLRPENKATPTSPDPRGRRVSFTSMWLKTRRATCRKEGRETIWCCAPGLNARRDEQRAEGGGD